ncbi:hypothetical protein [Mycobacterium sp.]|uniref:hypothetical protein n=1 Tax=Mycobacterium sp. TaxID=1785 RepID=UPI002BA1AD11|nr:hypothetical protein [Mycobacterium sp.]HTY35045.1 hypothetical protein [Mycobacterium sp.]
MSNVRRTLGKVVGITTILTTGVVTAAHVANADYPGVSEWYNNRASEHFQQSINVLDRISNAINAYDFNALHSACEDLHDANAVCAASRYAESGSVVD